MIATADQKYQLTAPHESYTMCQVSAIHKKSRSVSYPSPTDRWDHPLKSLQLPAKKNHLHPQKQSSSPSSLQNQTKTKKKPAVANSSWSTYHHLTKLYSPACSHSVLPAHWSMHTIHSATSFRRVSPPNKDGLPQERYPIFTVCHHLICCKILPHSAHYIIISSLLPADLPGNKHIHLFCHSRREKEILRYRTSDSTAHATINNSMTNIHFSESAFLPLFQFWSSFSDQIF